MIPGVQKATVGYSECSWTNRRHKKWHASTRYSAKSDQGVRSGKLLLQEFDVQNIFYAALLWRSYTHKCWAIFGSSLPFSQAKILFDLDDVLLILSFVAT